MSIVSGTTSGVMAANAQRDANKANDKNARYTLRQNKREFEQSRGSKGNAILPWYLKTEDGKAWEGEVLGRDMMAAYDATGAMSPEEKLAAYESKAAGFDAMQAGARARAEGVFNGDVTADLTSNAASTQAARMEIPKLTKQAAVEALDKTLNEISAAQAARGFSGDSLAASRLRFDANRDANTAAATATGAARLANAEEMRSILDYGNVQLPMSSLSLPYEMARREVDMSNLGQDAYLDNLARRLQPLNFLNIGTGQFQYAPMPTVNPVAGAGQLAMMQTANVGNAMLRDYMGQREAGRIANNYWNSSRPSGTYSSPTASYPDWSTPAYAAPAAIAPAYAGVDIGAGAAAYGSYDDAVAALL